MAGIYAAMRETFAVPENDLFTVIHEHTDSAFAYDPAYLETSRDDDLVVIQITANDTRDTGQKRALYGGDRPQPRGRSEGAAGEPVHQPRGSCT
ncbi:tautomerase family protein [Methylobacterium marchantiae]|uniref:Tautomerase family protein n=1 Tax=Methylobacterium marchantiae TaxID=600331 RepID=A0ABW3WV23_9HYPH|nr:hypothetical protein AIGOOFII_0429 [Methylobacterium marchantiae]